MTTVNERRKVRKVKIDLSQSGEKWDDESLQILKTTFEQSRDLAAIQIATKRTYSAITQQLTKLGLVSYHAGRKGFVDNDDNMFILYSTLKNMDKEAPVVIQSEVAEIVKAFEGGEDVGTIAARHKMHVYDLVHILNKRKLVVKLGKNQYFRANEIPENHKLRLLVEQFIKDKGITDAESLSQVAPEALYEVLGSMMDVIIKK